MREDTRRPWGSIPTSGWQRRVLVTGHTGFKGAWLSLWLQSLGAEVTGLAPGPPTQPSLYELAGVGANMREHAVDVRDAGAVREALQGGPGDRAAPGGPADGQALAARSGVDLRGQRDGHRERARGRAPGWGEVRAVVVVTSDKCYENLGEASRRFVEGDRLGGDDPYSSSKACAELVTAAYRSSFFSAEGDPQVATARAGNVIGGGDWGEDRLVADIVRAVDAGEPLRVRNPQAVRPWQHVLNPLSGYLRLAEQLSQTSEAARPWNFGPHEQDARTVSWIVERLGRLGGALSGS